MSSETEIRIAKARKLQDAGHDPYHPARFERNHSTEDVRINYSISTEAYNNKSVAVAGRVTAIRDMGKSLFFDIVDQDGKIQVHLKRDTIGDEKYNLFKDCVDTGDWIGVSGRPFKTRSGELTVSTEEYRFLTKSTRPLPLGKESAEGTHGVLEDAETIYRQPEVGMATDRVRFNTLRKRAQIIRAIRENLWNHGFDETDTPVLETVYGGANARPFVTNVNALNKLPVFLRISLELPLKRLIAGGLEGVFHLGHVFRNEGIDRSHNPEFSLLEVYKTLWDYNDVMNLTEKLITETAQKVNGSLVVAYGDNIIDLTPPWKRITMYNIIREETGVDVTTISDLELKALAARQNTDILSRAGIQSDTSDAQLVEAVQRYNRERGGTEGKIPIDTSRGNLIAYLFEELVEPKIIQPTFVIDHPKETSPLCKLHRANPELIERFELFINGWEFANAYSELNDPMLQRKLLEDQAKELRAGNEEAMPFDENFVRAIEYGIPTTGGLGIGIDRLVMLLTAKDWPKNSPPTIRDVIFFPLMKPKD